MSLLGEVKAEEGEDTHPMTSVSGESGSSFSASRCWSRVWSPLLTIALMLNAILDFYFLGWTLKEG